MLLLVLRSLHKFPSWFYDARLHKQQSFLWCTVQWSEMAVLTNQVGIEPVVQSLQVTLLSVLSKISLMDGAIRRFSHVLAICCNSFKVFLRVFCDSATDCLES